MSRRSPVVLVCAFSSVILCASNARSQGVVAPQAATDQQQPAKQTREQRLKLEGKAAALVEQLVTESQALALAENRARVDLVAGDLLWARDEERARSLFAEAGAQLAQMWQAASADDEEGQRAAQLRQELVLAAARHDAELALRLLRSTRDTRPARAEARDALFGPDPDGALERNLLDTIAAGDPKAALRRALEWLDHGEYPSGIASLLRRLRTRDREAFDKLSRGLIDRLNSDALLANEAACDLALDLLRPGARPDESHPPGPPANPAGTSSMRADDRVLGEAAYRELSSAAISAALTAGPETPQTTRGGDAVALIDGGGSLSLSFFTLARAHVSPPDVVRQENARRLLSDLQAILPQIARLAPERARALRQRSNELGAGDDPAAHLGLVAQVLNQNTSESLLSAADSAPAELRQELYERAAVKAIEEGDTDRARRISAEHLTGMKRDALERELEIRKLSAEASTERLAQIRQRLPLLPSDSERVRLLVELARAAQAANPKFALALLEDARRFVVGRALKYEDFDNRLKVAEACASIDPRCGFALVDSDVQHLNELLAAAEVLNGFESQVFRGGEMPLKGESELGKTVARYGWSLGALAESDFDGAVMTADHFQRADARVLAKLSLAERLLGSPSNAFADDERRGEGMRVYSLGAK